MGRKRGTKASMWNEPFKFLPQEINRKFTTVNVTDAAQLLHLANSTVDKWSSRGFELFRLADYKAPSDDNPTVQKLLKSKAGDELDGAHLSIAVQSFRKLRDGVYKVSIKPDDSNTTIEQFADQIKEEIFADAFTDGIVFFEHVITRLRHLKTNERLVIYYPGLESGLDFEEQGCQWNFNIDDLSAPIKEVLSEGYPGFSDGRYMYIATNGGIFPIHLDDYEANACNLLLYGGSKLWIIISKVHKRRLNRLVCKRKCDLNHKNLFLDPGFLRKHRIPFLLVNQQPGDLIMLARSTYHQGINYTGDKKMVVATAVNTFLADYFLEFDDFYKEIITCDCGHSPIIIPAPIFKNMCIRIREVRDDIRRTRADISVNGPPQPHHEVADVDIPDLHTLLEQVDFLRSQQEAWQRDVEQLKMELTERNKEMMLANKESASRIELLEMKTKSLQEELNTLKQGIKGQQNAHNSAVRHPTPGNSRHIPISGQVPLPVDVNSDKKTCDQCGRKFATIRNMLEHRLMHFESNRIEFKCDLCDKVYLRKNALNNHKMTIHEGRKFSCKCGKTYAQNQKLNQHMRTCSACSDEIAG